MGKAGVERWGCAAHPGVVEMVELYDAGEVAVGVVACGEVGLCTVRRVGRVGIGCYSLSFGSRGSFEFAVCVA